MRLLTGLFLGLASGLGTGWAADMPLKSYTAEYKVSASGLDLGKLMVKLDINGNHYRYTKATDASGLMKWISNDDLKESSEGTVDDTGPRPVDYSYLHTRRKGTKEEQVKFSASKITGHYNNAAFSLPYQEGLQDKASQDIKLMLKARPDIDKLSVNVVDKGKIRQQIYRVEGREILHIGGKDYNTIKLLVERDNSARQTYFWLAPELKNIPVQFSHKDGDDKPTVQSRLVNLKMMQ